jgi:hypothetical protein
VMRPKHLRCHNLHRLGAWRVAVPPRLPHGTVTHVAGEAHGIDEERFRDGPALTAQIFQHRRCCCD